VELEEYVGAPSISLTLEKRQDAEIKYSNGLLEKIIDRNNLNQAFKRVKAVIRRIIPVLKSQIKLS